MCHEWVEVPVAVEQSQVFFDAACRDQTVDWFAHRDTEVAQTTAIARSRDCAVGAAEFDDLEHEQRILCPCRIAIAAKTLKQFHEDQVADHERRRRVHQLFQADGLGSW